VRKTFRTIVRVLAVVAFALVAVIALGLAFLAYPGEPGSSRAVHFEGYILLPKHGMLNVLDYFTLADRTVFVTGASSGSVFEIAIDPSRPVRDSQVTEWPGEPRTHGVALVPQRGLAFVTRSGKNTVDVFARSSARPVAHIPVADDPDAILYDQGSDIIYAASGDSHTATLIDPEKRATVATFKLEGKPEFAAIDPWSRLLYQNIEDTNALVAIDLSKRAVVGRWSLAPCVGPTGAAIEVKTRRLFAVCSRNATMVVFDLDRHKIIATLPIGRGADAVDIDPDLHRIYTTGLDGNLTIVEETSPTSYRVMDRIATHFAAHTLGVDSALHRVYIGYASLFVAPRIAVFSETP
jgi:DNA-binding beta-propeller fold protein YncE